MLSQNPEGLPVYLEVSQCMASVGPGLSDRQERLFAYCVAVGVRPTEAVLLSIVAEQQSVKSCKGVQVFSLNETCTVSTCAFVCDDVFLFTLSLFTSFSLSPSV